MELFEALSADEKKESHDAQKGIITRVGVQRIIGG